MKKILQALEAFDGKQVKPLVELAESLKVTTTNIRKLLAAAEHDRENVRLAATWVLKNWQESGVRFSSDVKAKMVRLLEQDIGWGAQLHLLQVLDKCFLPEAAANSLLKSATCLATSQNKFVRAWAMSVAIRLADQHQEFRAAALALLDQAAEDSAASVKARVRQLRNKYSWIR